MHTFDVFILSFDRYLSENRVRTERKLSENASKIFGSHSKLFLKIAVAHGFKRAHSIDNIFTTFTAFSSFYRNFKSSE